VRADKEEKGKRKESKSRYRGTNVSMNVDAYVDAFDEWMNIDEHGMVSGTVVIQYYCAPVVAADAVESGPRN
jgi:hypothetical protein